MKTQVGIWIDTSKAIIVTLIDGKEYTLEIASEIENSIHHNSEGNKGSFMGNTHVNNEKKFDEKMKNQINDFLKNVINKIKHEDAFYVFGPAEMKIKLKNLIKNNNEIASKLKAVETADSMTLNQVIAKVKAFYSI
jgi:superfamily I DNA and/or RNA helicase